MIAPIDLEDDYADPDRRMVARVTMRRASGKLTVSGVEQRCRVRDLTPIGVGLETPDPPLPGQRVWIEIPGMARTAAVVIWREQNRCGLRFETVQGPEPAIDDDDGRTDRKPRAYRFFLKGPVAFENRKGFTRVDAMDISTGGLKLRGLPEMQVGGYGIVRLDGSLGDLPGYVRWREAEIAGFSFARSIPQHQVIGLVNRLGIQ